MEREGGDTKRTVTSNFAWRFSERILAQLVAFAVSIVIARILDPDDYGTVALITVVIAILQVLVDSGLGNALIQKKEADDLDFSTVFYANICFCICLYVLVFFGAPLIAEFYNDNTMTPYIRVLGITILVSGVKNVQQAYVSRHMLFRKFFFATLGGTLVAGVVGVSMAFAGYGVWALIAQQLVNLTIDTVILWITVDWRPIMAFSFERLKTLFSYGWKLLLSALFDTGYKELRQLIIGKKYTSTDLAYYNKGEQFPQLIVTNINSSIDSVLLPTLAREQDNVERVKAMTRRSIQVSTFVMAPLMVGLAAISEPLVRLLLTEKWLPAVFFLRVISISCLVYPVHTANLNAIKAIGRSDLFLRLEIIKKVIGVIAIIVSMQISVEAMAYSLLVTAVISQAVNAWPNKNLLNYGYLDQLKDIIPNLLLAAFMGVCVFLITYAGLPDIATLCLQMVSGTVIYTLFAMVFRNESFLYLKKMSKEVLARKKHD